MSAPFNWHEAAQEIAALQTELNAAQRHYQTLSQVKEDLLGRAKAMVDRISETDQAVASLEQRQTDLEQAVSILESQYEQAQRRNEAELPGLEATYRSTVDEHNARIDDLEARFRNLGDQLEQEYEAKKHELHTAMVEAEKAHREQLAAWDVERAAAQQRMQQLRSEVQTVAASIQVK